MTYYDRWAKDPTWTSGPRSGKDTKIAPTQAQVEQGLIGGLTFKCQQINWQLEQMATAQDRLLFGDGFAGAVVLGPGVTTITEDLRAATLSIPVGATLRTAGHRVFCTESITIEGTVDGTSSQYEGGLGQFAAVGLPGEGNAVSCLGGAGAAGGDGATANGGAGGAFAGPYRIGAHVLDTLAGMRHFSTGASFLYATSLHAIEGGAGGGGGGGGAASTGASGGPGGGLLLLAAPEIIEGATGAVTCAGTPGSSTGAAGAGGGGGGGGGVIIYVRHRRIVNNVTYFTDGGLGGTGGGAGGLNGADGANGQFVDIEI